MFLWKSLHHHKGGPIWQQIRNPSSKLDTQSRQDGNNLLVLLYIAGPLVRFNHLLCNVQIQCFKIVTHGGRHKKLMPGACWYHILHFSFRQYEQEICFHSSIRARDFKGQDIFLVPLSHARRTLWRSCTYNMDQYLVKQSCDSFWEGCFSFEGAWSLLPGKRFSGKKGGKKKLENRT